MNKPLASRPVMREVFARIGLPEDVSAALMSAAKHARKHSPETETMAQMFVSVADTLGVEALKIVVGNPFHHAYLRNNYAHWHGIKGAKAKKLLKRWSSA